MKRIKTNASGGKTVVERFDNVSLFWAGINGKETQKAFKPQEASLGTGKFRFDFTGTNNIEEATKLLLEGDRQNADKVLQSVMAIKRQVGKETKRQRVGTGVVGFAPNVPNFLAGVPRNMITATPSKRKDKIINLVYNIGAGCTIEKETLQQAVINLAGAIVALEAGGARVQVFANWTVYETKRGGGKHFTSLFVKIKSAAQPLDVLKMVYPLGHPSMLRRHAFRWMEITKDIPDCFRGGYGSQVAPTEVGQICADAGVKCDRVLDYKVASDNDYKALARMIDTGVII